MKHTPETRQPFLMAILLLALAGSLDAIGQTNVSEDLPIEVQRDLLNSDLQRALREGDNEGISTLIRRMRSLDMDLHDNLYFFEARALFLTGNALGSRDQLLVYLANTGREGRYYQQATELLLTVKDDAERQEAEQRKQQIDERQQVAEERQHLREISRGTEADYTTRVKEAQLLLYELGFILAGDNGQLSTPTREAIAVYQVRRNLQVNAELTDETLEKLRSEVPQSHTCDTLAGYPRSPKEWRVTLNNIPGQVALTNCQEALGSYPQVIRFQIQTARAMLTQKRYAEATRLVNPAAEAGYPPAQMVMGTILEVQGNNGGESEDVEAAFSWYLRAAEASYPPAQVRVGFFHERGLGGLRRSEIDALTWYVRSSDQGYPPGLVIVGDRYMTGSGGVKRNYEVAAEKFSQAAEAGYADAQFLLGELYEKGRGVRKDKTAAIMWYQRAADLQHEGAAKRLSRIN